MSSLLVFLCKQYHERLCYHTASRQNNVSGSFFLDQEQFFYPPTYPLYDSSWCFLCECRVLRLCEVSKEHRLDGTFMNLDGLFDGQQDQNEFLVIPILTCPLKVTVYYGLPTPFHA